MAYLTNEYDSVLSDISGLTWLPWIGKNYSSDTKEERLMVVGESHYTNNPSPEGAKQDIEKTLHNSNYTRDVIFESPIQVQWTNPTFTNLHRALLGTSDINGGELWKELSFYTFIQRPMEYRKRERPVWVDFYKSWQIFVSVIRVLQPKVCLFIGVEASNSFNQAMQELKVEHEMVKWDRKISRTYSRLGSVIINGVSTQLVFMQHSSQMFSWSQWHEYLKGVMPEEITHLYNKILKSSSIPTEQGLIESQSSEESISRTQNIPKHLMHKPIIACNYSDVTGDELEDAKYLSIGHAQYNHDCASVKLWRRSGNRWSRQSEEVPIDRLFDMALMLGNVIKAVQNKGKLSQSLLMEEVIAEEDISFLQQEIEQGKTRIMQSAKELRDILASLDLEEV